MKTRITKTSFYMMVVGVGGGDLTGSIVLLLLDMRCRRTALNECL
jgi:hypothetical protein